jgi:hypothetical protein
LRSFAKQAYLVGVAAKANLKREEKKVIKIYQSQQKSHIKREFVKGKGGEELARERKGKNAPICFEMRTLVLEWQIRIVAAC